MRVTSFPTISMHRASVIIIRRHTWKLNKEKKKNGFGHDTQAKSRGSTNKLQKGNRKTPHMHTSKQPKNKMEKVFPFCQFQASVFRRSKKSVVYFVFFFLFLCSVPNTEMHLIFCTCSHKYIEII